MMKEFVNLMFAIPAVYYMIAFYERLWQLSSWPQHFTYGPLVAGGVLTGMVIIGWYGEHELPFISQTFGCECSEGVFLTTMLLIWSVTACMFISDLKKR